MLQIRKTVSDSLSKELDNILNYWSTNTIDEVYGGFVGERDHYNNLIPNANKGIILNSRILWAFSAASNHYNTESYKDICLRSYSYLKNNFKDTTYGGVFWELDAKGNPVNTRKQTYAHAFTIYALSEYYACSKDSEALGWAIEIYEHIEKYAKDTLNNGYIEAFKMDWTTITDMRLSDKDANAAKTMNTHLHLLEAYTNLLRVYENKGLKMNLTNLIELFLHKFLRKDNHLQLFFDKTWNAQDAIISFGHDIETAWLLIDAAKIVKNEKLILETEKVAIQIANTFIKEGVDTDGGVFNEFNTETQNFDTDKHWWPQVEALIGLDYAYQITKNKKYLEIAWKTWTFIQAKIIDTENGEWFSRVNILGRPYTSEYKVGMWKAPYHNSRACIKLTIK
jgi:mannobiose 2-epimerase